MESALARFVPKLNTDEPPDATAGPEGEEESGHTTWKPPAPSWKERL
jgi:hypothetical protein